MLMHTLPCVQLNCVTEGEDFQTNTIEVVRNIISGFIHVSPVPSSILHDILETDVLAITETECLREVFEGNY
jgi:hypothetical protein